MVFDEQGVNGFVPAGALLVETVLAVGVVSAPFVETRKFDPSALVFITPDQVVDENELEFRAAGCKGGFEPGVLRAARWAASRGLWTSSNGVAYQPSCPAARMSSWSMRVLSSVEALATFQCFRQAVPDNVR